MDSLIAHHKVLAVFYSFLHPLIFYTANKITHYLRTFCHLSTIHLQDPGMLPKYIPLEHLPLDVLPLLPSQQFLPTILRMSFKNTDVDKRHFIPSFYFPATFGSGGLPS